MMMLRLYSTFFFFFISVITLVSQTANKYTKADTLRGTLSEYRLCYNVLSYDLNVKVDVKNKFISGNNLITFKAEFDFSKLQIDLFENMKIEKILFEEKELTYTREFNAVFVDMGRVVKKGEKRNLNVFYSGNPRVAVHAPWDGGFSWDKDEEGKPWVGVSCQELGASSWWPCKDHQSDEPENMWIRATVPDKLMDVSNGRLKKITPLENNWTKYDWYVSYPINNYLVTLNIGNYKHIHDTFKHPDYKDTLTLDYYVLPENVKKAKKHFEQVKPMMNCFYNVLGEYPFVKDGYKLVETPYLGMEHQSCIAYGNKYKTGYLGKDYLGAGFDFDYIIIHETAHEWWGNNITTNDIADMWIHEGFGTYSEALYIECLYGYEAYLKYINSEKKSVDNDGSIIGDYGVNNRGDNDMYPKGALIVHTLRSILNNDSLFFQVIKEVQKDFRHSTVNSSDIEKYISEKSGVDLSDFFELYLKSASVPKLEMKLEPDTLGGFLLSYRYVLKELGINDFKKIQVPVKVTLKKDEYFFIYPTVMWKSIRVKDMKPEDFKFADDLFYVEEELTIVKD